MPRQGNPPITQHDIATNALLDFDLIPGFNDAHLITLNYTFNELYMVLQIAPEWNGGRWHSMKMETRKSKEQCDADIRSMVQCGKDDNLPDIPDNPSMQVMVWKCSGCIAKEVIHTVSAFVCVHDPDIVVLVGAPNIEKCHKKFGPQVTCILPTFTPWAAEAMEMFWSHTRSTTLKWSLIGMMAMGSMLLLVTWGTTGSSPKHYLRLKTESLMSSYDCKLC
ncbi:hypothetical protein RHSIM_Rhsim08G0133600 [Rhododendron simsii]|uniref:Uncharacterized protein n=1 Tax=Rhododendron simsii TaxID=118357 RepID=A0A834GM08_RHOSS|nr:hypothetical protein RHSIM_Rhsim08G0133600 [Rhododendron simsii]